METEKEKKIELVSEKITCELPDFKDLIIRFMPYEFGALCIVECPLKSDSKQGSMMYLQARYWMSRDKKGEISARRLEGFYPNTPQLLKSVETSYEHFIQNQQVDQRGGGGKS